MRKGAFLLSAALLTGAIPLLAQTTETRPTPETKKTIWYDSITGARHFKIEQTTNNDGVQKKTVQHVIMRSGATADPASVVISDSVAMEDVIIKADDGEKNVVRLRRMVAPNAAAMTWATDSTAIIQDVLVNTDDVDVLQFNNEQTEDAPHIMMMDVNTEDGENTVFFHQAVPPAGMEGAPQIMTIDIRGEEGGEGQMVVREPAQFQILDLQNAENIRIEGGTQDIEVQIDKLMQELKARDGELKKVLEENSTQPGKIRKEIRIVRRSLDSAQRLIEVARGEMAKVDKRTVCVTSPIKCDSALISRMCQNALTVVNAPVGANVQCVKVAPFASFAPVAPVPPVAPLPPDADVLMKAFSRPQMVMLSGDSVSIVEQKDGERVVRVFELGNRDTTLVINETDHDGAHRTITLFNGPLTMMSAGNKNLRVICMKGDSMVANVDQKVIVIGPRYAQAKAMLEEMKHSQDAPQVIAKSVTSSQAGGYMLHDAMPNPASGSVTVNFTLPEAGQATLELYDANGTVVKTMANGDHAAGDHAVTFDTSDLSSGTYFYRLTSGDFVQSKALQVVK